MQARHISIVLGWLFTSLYSTISTDGVKPYKLVCYWDTSSLFRAAAATFDAGDIDQLLCTHLVFRSVRFGTDGYVIFYAPNQNPDKQQTDEYFKSFLKLKELNPDLILLVSMGDSSESAHYFSEDGGSYADYVRNFVAATVEFLNEYNFDGLDLDLNYLALRQGSSDEKRNYVTLLKALRTELNRRNLFLTALVSAEKDVVDLAYDVPAMTRIVDFFNVMSFDFYGGAEKFAGINAPLYSPPGDKYPERNVDFAMKYWIEAGAPKEKLVMGVASFGRSFTLRDPLQHQPGSEVIGYGKAGPYLRKAGTLAAFEICEAVNNDLWSWEYDIDREAPYAYKQEQWVGYDNDESIEVKTKYANTQGLAGIMFWTLDTDDFMGKCGRRHTLLMTVYDTLNQREVLPTPYTTETPYTKPYHGDPECHAEGYFPYPGVCKKFIRCVGNGNGAGFTLYVFTCAKGTVFDERLQNCNFPKAVPGCENET